MDLPLPTDLLQYVCINAALLILKSELFNLYTLYIFSYKKH